METEAYEKDGFVISTNKKLLDVDYVYNYLSKESYWAQNIPLETVIRSIEHSLCFGIYKDDKQIGFARLITDYATFAWLCDVFIDASFRGFGLSKWLMETIYAHPKLQGLRAFMLRTIDAHRLYAQFGYGPLPEPQRFMRRPAQNPQ